MRVHDPLGVEKMNQFTQAISAVVLAIAMSSCCTGTIEPVDLNETPSTTIEKLLEAMKADLTGVKEYASKEGMRLDAIELTVNAASSTIDSGSLKILILKVGGSGSMTNTNEYTVVLKEVDAATGTSLDDAVDGFAASLREIIDAQPSVADMTTTKIVGKLQFALQEKSGGNVNFEIEPITADFGREVVESYTHTLKLTFELG